MVKSERPQDLDRVSPTEVMLQQRLQTLLQSLGGSADLANITRRVFAGSVNTTSQIPRLLELMNERTDLSALTLADLLHVLTMPTDQQNQQKDTLVLEVLSFMQEHELQQLVAAIDRQIAVREGNRVLRQVDDLRELLADAKEQSGLDALTGLLNRKGLMSWFAHNHADNLSNFFGSKILLLQFDIDKFKNINDAYGHERGDSVLRIVGRILREHLRDEDALARWGGEEFWVVIALKDGDEARGLAQNKYDAINEAFMNAVMYEARINAGATLSCGAQIARWNDETTALSWLGREYDSQERPTVEKVIALSAIFAEYVLRNTNKVRKNRLGKEETFDHIAANIRLLQKAVGLTDSMSGEGRQEVNKLYSQTLIDVFIKLFNIFSWEGDQALYLAKGELAANVRGTDQARSRDVPLPTRNQIRFGPSMGALPD